MEQEQKIQETFDGTFDATLRPSRWDEYVGQETTKTNIRLIIDAAKARGEAPDHMLFYGQPGLGKTTLAYLVAKELNTQIRSTSGPALEKAGDVAALLTNLEPHDILFIDEAHRVNTAIEEILYPAMESRKIHLIVGKGPSARTFSLDLPPFTIIAATTRANLLSAPLRSRFGATFRLDYYNAEDIQKIIEQSAKILGITIKKEASEKLAHASRFTPRTANRLLKRARDYAQIYNNNAIDVNAVYKTLELFEIDEFGLDKTDREILSIIIEKFNGGPVGLKSLGAALNEEPGTIEDVYEPFLIKIGLLHRTPGGRIATKLAYELLGYKEKEGGLF
ncbi:MAG: holliday junction DNA helicase RuvB [Parcubacteria group bacterium LiPW_41]|nr:MAG: holliday junction DNA helicase RuvB [Parcubacteria group bacterium LiPW_41]